MCYDNHDMRVPAQFQHSAIKWSGGMKNCYICIKLVIFLAKNHNTGVFKFRAISNFSISVIVFFHEIRYFMNALAYRNETRCVSSAPCSENILGAAPPCGQL